MTFDPEMQLDKILMHAKNAYGFAEGIDLQAFHTDLIRRSAVVGRIIALGMASRSLPNETKSDLSDVPWKKLEAMADALLRDYDDVDPAVIWETATQVLPQVIRTLSLFLERYPES